MTTMDLGVTFAKYNDFKIFSFIYDCMEMVSMITSHKEDETCRMARENVGRNTRQPLDNFKFWNVCYINQVNNHMNRPLKVLRDIGLVRW